MAIILIAIFILFITRALAQKKTLSVVIGAVLFIVSAGKSVIADSDLPGYARSYYALRNYTLGELWQQSLGGVRKEFGYYATANIFSELGFDAEVWFGVIALFFGICAAIAFYKNSADPFISVIMLFTFYFSFTLTGLRQTIAMGFVLLSYRYIRERRFWPYLLILLIAVTFHVSAIIFLPAYWLINMRVGYKHLFIVGGAFIVCYAIPGIVRAFISQFSSVDRLQGYIQHERSLNWTLYLMQLCLIIFCLVFRLNIPREQRESYVDPYINLMVIGLCLQGVSSIVAEAFRLSYYYAIASMFALPNTIANMERNNAKLAYLAVCGVFLAYTVYSDSYTAYQFFGFA